MAQSRSRSQEQHYRLAWHEWDRHLILVSPKTVEIIDFVASISFAFFPVRTTQGSHLIICQTGNIQQVIDFEGSSTRILDLYSHHDLETAPYACLLTSENLVWFDPAQDGQIMLSWKHYLPTTDEPRLFGIPIEKREFR